VPVFLRPLARSAACVLGLALSACTTLGPDYSEPQVSWLGAWEQSQLHGLREGAGAGGETDLEFWWKRFADPGLNALLSGAREANPSLRIAGLRILESRARIGIATSGRYPQIQQATSAVALVNSHRFGGALPNDSQNLAQYDVGFGLAWELDFWGRFQRGIESADAAFFASVAAQQDLQVLLTAQVTDLYFAYRTVERRLEVTRDNINLRERSYEITRHKFESGDTSELDVQQARTQLLVTQSTVPELESNLVQIRNALCAVLGRPPGALPELDTGSDSWDAVGGVELAALPAALMMRRPDVRAAAWQVAAQSAQIGIAEAEFYPAVSLLGNLAWSGNSLDATPYSAAIGVGPSVRWNLFDHGRIRNNVRLQDALLQQLIEGYQLTVLEAAREIDDAAVQIVKTAERDRLIKESVAAASRALELANTRYREGLTNFQRVLDSQRALYSQQEQRIVNFGNHISAIISLYKGLGGGWSEATIETLLPAETRDSMRTRTDWGDLLDTPPAGSASDLP